MKPKTMQDYFQQAQAYITKADLYSSKVMADISVALIHKRLSLNMSQKEFAKLMGVSQGMISKWESGAYNFTVNAIAEIAEKIGSTFDILLEPEGAAQRKSYLGKDSFGDPGYHFEGKDDSQGIINYNDLVVAA